MSLREAMPPAPLMEPVDVTCCHCEVVLHMLHYKIRQVDSKLV